MSSHYIGTAEIKSTQGKLLGVLHRYRTQSGFIEYWLVMDEFHLWESGADNKHDFEFLGRNPTNDKLMSFRIFGKARFQQVQVGTDRLRLWKHVIAPESL